MIRVVAVLLASLVSLSLYGEKSTIGQDEDTLEWLDDYDAAIALAKKTRRPVFLEFRCSP